MAKKKSKPMSPALKRFLKKHGRFPKKGELKRVSKRRRKTTRPRTRRKKTRKRTRRTRAPKRRRTRARRRRHKIKRPRRSSGGISFG